MLKSSIVFFLVLIFPLSLGFSDSIKVEDHQTSAAPSVHELTKQFLETSVMAGGLASKENSGKETPENQATKAITSVETLKLLESQSKIHKKTIESPLPPLAAETRPHQAQLSFSPQEWWQSLQQSISRDNLVFVTKAFSRIMIILMIYMILRRLINHFVSYYLQKIPSLHTDRNTQSTTVAIIKTVSPIIRSTIHWILIILAGLLILSELNINIMPIIYSFSVIGLAISIGSQTLVKDLINGVMTLFEGNMAVGDIVTVGTFKGEVESISLRCIHLRHSTGELQTIPFSEVNHVINHSRDYSIADIRFIVSYQANLEEVDRILQTTFDQLQNNKDYKHYVIGDLKRLGVKRLDEWGVVLHASIRTIPDPYQRVASEFYRLLIPELQKKGIPMAVSPGSTLSGSLSDTKGPKLA